MKMGKGVVTGSVIIRVVALGFDPIPYYLYAWLDLKFPKTRFTRFLLRMVDLFFGKTVEVWERKIPKAKMSLFTKTER